MKKEISEQNIFILDENEFQQGISIDCVIIGFHEGTLKVLLNKFIHFDKWMLPGGFVYKDEGINEAAIRLLTERTRLEKIFLRQFHTFGDCNRTNNTENKDISNNGQYRLMNTDWLLQRFITIGYFALVDYSKIELPAISNQDAVKWFDINELPELYADHNKIVAQALISIRQQLDYIPFGLELLPKKFALSELRLTYETLLGKELDRRNFQRKIMTLDILEKLDELRKNWGHRTATLYSFDEEKYKKAVENGISLVNW